MTRGLQFQMSYTLQTRPTAVKLADVYRIDNVVDHLTAALMSAHRITISATAMLPPLLVAGLFCEKSSSRLVRMALNGWTLASYRFPPSLDFHSARQEAAICWWLINRVWARVAFPVPPS